MEKLSGGAIQENWHLQTDQGDYVLRTDAPSSLSTSHSRPEEFAILKVAFEAGVMAPKPVLQCQDPSIIGAPFYLMEKAEGIAQGRKITRDANLPQIGRAIAQDLGHELAKLHKITPPEPSLPFLDIPENPAQRRIDGYRADLDNLPDGHPVIEFALNWLEDHQPKSQIIRLCHTDYRTGNYMIHQGRLTAILDWEFASWSDPHEDLGWLCARCWRFGNDHLKVGGISDLEPFLNGYNSHADAPIDPSQIPYWQIMAEVRWAVIALQQAERCHAGETTLELALTGPLAAEMEFNMLNLIESQT